MTVSRAAFVVIVGFAAWASFSASTGFARAHGADVAHVWAIPACLEALALSAAWQRITRRDGSAAVVFWLAFAAAVAINVAHGWPSRVLMVLYGLPPAALVGGGHLFLRDLAHAKPRTRRRSRPRAAGTPARTPTPTSAQPAHVNGQRPRTQRVTLDDLRRMFPNEHAVTQLREQHGSWRDAWASVGATLSQGNKLRAEHRHH